MTYEQKQHVLPNVAKRILDYEDCDSQFLQRATN